MSLRLKHTASLWLRMVGVSWRLNAVERGNFSPQLTGLLLGLFLNGLLLELFLDFRQTET